MTENERAWEADKRAVVRQARRTVEKLDLLLAAWRLQRAAPRLIRKIYPYDYYVLDDTIYR